MRAGPQVRAVRPTHRKALCQWVAPRPVPLPRSPPTAVVPARRAGPGRRASTPGTSARARRDRARLPRAHGKPSSALRSVAAGRGTPVSGAPRLSTSAGSGSIPGFSRHARACPPPDEPAPCVYSGEGRVVDARIVRARRPRSCKSTRPASAAAASRAARSNASSSSGPVAATSWPISRRMVPSALDAIKGSATPSIQTRVRRPSPRSPR